MSKTTLILLPQCRILKIRRVFTRKLLMQEEQQMRGRGCVVITGDNWFILGSVGQDPIEGVPFPPCQSSSVTQRNLLQFQIIPGVCPEEWFVCDSVSVLVPAAIQSLFAQTRLEEKPSLGALCFSLGSQCRKGLTVQLNIPAVKNK